MISEKELKKEKDYLRTVLYILEKEIKLNKDILKDYDVEIKEDLKYIWDETNGINETEREYAINRIQTRSMTTDFSERKIKTYEQMIKSAYFARIDFDDGEEVTPVYIGIASLENGQDLYVYDWRTPIAGMFYEFEPGLAEYTVPSGEKVSGRILLKRQYVIENDKIKQIFDTDVQVIDKVLQGLLQSKASAKMKNIVTSIQKEQNKIIRKNDADILIVQGPAGSGKTSVAMHKIAYLLYKERAKITNSNILILSPNNIFSDYISDVLPQIGEKNVYQTTFMDYIKNFLTDFKIKGDVNSVYETYYGEDKTSKEYSSIKLKYGATYINLIENYLKLRRKDMLYLTDIKYDGEVAIDTAYLTKLADELENSGKSIYEQGAKLIERILLHVSIKFGKDKAFKKKLIKTLESNIKKIDTKSLYMDLYSDRERFVHLIEEIYNTTGTQKKMRLSIKELTSIFDYTREQLNRGLIPFEDVSGYMYLRDRLYGNASQHKIKYLLVDEAQDYSLMQYAILADLFRHANISLFGDINQSIMPFSTSTNYESIMNILAEERKDSKKEMAYLTKTYRSTYEINMFAKHLIGETNLYNQIDRHGDEVKIIKDTKDIINSQIIKDAIELKQYYNTLAIICKTQNDTEDFAKLLENPEYAAKFKIVTGNDRVFEPEKIMIIPSYIAKGLEFDACLVYNANDDKYAEDCVKLFYVVCTRAMHKLNIYYTDKLTKLIK